MAPNSKKNNNTKRKMEQMLFRKRKIWMDFGAKIGYNKGSRRE